jgi:hypothetical protein
VRISCHKRLNSKGRQDNPVENIVSTTAVCFHDIKFINGARNDIKHKYTSSGDVLMGLYLFLCLFRVLNDLICKYNNTN